MVIQSSTDPHPRERFDTVLGKSEMTTRHGSKGKQKSYQQSGRDMDLSSVNALFRQPKSESSSSLSYPTSPGHLLPTPRSPSGNDNVNTNWPRSPGKGVHSDMGPMTQPLHQFNRAIGSPVTKPQPLMSSIVPEPNHSLQYDIHQLNTMEQHGYGNNSPVKNPKRLSFTNSSPHRSGGRGRGKTNENDPQQNHQKQQHRQQYQDHHPPRQYQQQSMLASANRSILETGGSFPASRTSSGFEGMYR